MTCRNRTLEEIIKVYGDIPYCKCDECQKNKVKIKISPDKNGSYSRYKNGYPEYLPGHSNRGENNGMFGKKRPEHSLRMSGSGNPMFENPREDLQIKFKGEGNPMFGKEPWNKNKPWSEEVKIKIRKPRLNFRGKSCHRYGKSPNHSKKTFIHYTPFQGEIKMHKWEHIYASHLDSINELYLYEPDFFELNINGRDTTYTPDFILPIKNKFVEIKGYWRDDAKLKSDTFKEQYKDTFNYEVLFKEDLINLGIDLNMREK